MKKISTYFAGAFALCASLPLFADEAAPAQGGNLMQTLMMIAVALAFFYFILWRPEQKRRKQMESLRTSLKKGDRITAMGIIGTVVKVEENTVILSLYDGSSKIEVLKAAITDVVPAADAAKVTVEANETR